MAKPFEPLLPLFPDLLVVSPTLTAAAFSRLFLKSISNGEQVLRRPFIEAPSHRASALLAPWGVKVLPSISELLLSWKKCTLFSACRKNWRENRLQLATECQDCYLCRY